MRIARELTTLFAGLFGPAPTTAQRAAKEAVRKTTPPKGSLQTGGSESLSPSPAGNSIDRVTLSERTVLEGAALKNGRDARFDLPSPLLPAIDSYGPDTGCQTSSATDTDRPVVALLPAASVNHQSPQSAANSSGVQESPETRRLVRSVYGSPQSASRPTENESGSRIRIRA